MRKWRVTYEGDKKFKMLWLGNLTGTDDLGDTGLGERMGLRWSLHK